jgi:hypothetical protein
MTTSTHPRELNKRTELTPPDVFEAFDDETIPVNRECPRCSYSWSEYVIGVAAGETAVPGADHG